ncbi:MAG TPA: TolC family protein [Thermoanaerobaculaceae bacterium]|nr:TolC family protein [Thermoanaerobaculaceae bacterium]
MKIQLILQAGCVTVFSLAASRVLAAPEAAPGVETLVEQALARAPSVTAMQAKLSAAREMVSPAGALPNPTLDVTLQDVAFPRWTVGSEEMSMIGPGYEQELPYPGKRDARREAAGAEAAVRAADLEQVQRELAAQVRALYARIYALDRESQYLAAAREMLEMLSATAASRYSVGEADQEAVLKAQLEVSRLAERLEDVAAERAGLVAALNRILDQPGAAALGRVEELPKPNVSPPPWEDLAVRASPAVAVRQASVAAAEKRVALARLDFKPDFTTGAAVGLRGGLDPAVVLRFGLVIPMWRKEKQEPLLHAAESELVTAQAELRDAEAAARSAAAKLAAEWLRATRQIELYQQAIVPQSSAAIDAARAAYLVGRGDFLTVVDDFNRWLDARVELARREADRFATWAELQALIGEPAGKES